MHFTVLLDPVRRLAAATAVIVDGARLLDLDRADDWHLDPRVPSAEQTGEEVSARNDLDRGHLVRRRDPVWGDPATARLANEATFVFTGPVFDPADPPYRGIRIPRLFWKIAAWITAGVSSGPELSAAGFVLDQSAQLADIDLESTRADVADPPPLGGFTTFEVPVADIQQLTGLTLDTLVAADRYQPSPVSDGQGGMRAIWRQLAQLSDIQL